MFNVLMEITTTSFPRPPQCNDVEDDEDPKLNLRCRRMVGVLCRNAYYCKVTCISNVETLTPKACLRRRVPDWFY